LLGTIQGCHVPFYKQNELGIFFPPVKVYLRCNME
jgi:hypothetical protein